MKHSIRRREGVFIDPTPVTSRSLSITEMETEAGGGPVAIVIITCGSGLGSKTIIITGSAIIAIAA